MVSVTDRLLGIILRWFFYLLYNPLAWAYDYVAAIVSFGQWEKWVQSALPYLTGGCILEVGHGPGHLLANLEKTADRQIFGLDLSRSMGKQAKHELELLSLPIRLVRAKAQRLPFADRTFDQVVSTFPAEYIFHPQTLSEIYRVLAPGGTLLVLPLVWIHPSNLFEQGQAWLFRSTHQSPPRDNDRWQSQRVSLFEQAGFTVQTIILEQKATEICLILATKSPIML